MGWGEEDQRVKNAVIHLTYLQTTIVDSFFCTVVPSSETAVVPSFHYKEYYSKTNESGQ